ncbi:MAG TPA: hypothetical protein VHD81_07330 [Mycobacteriales bacterium]|nr:hypothetical protein [Mycobacteriales bacterium]
MARRWLLAATAALFALQLPTPASASAPPPGVATIVTASMHPSTVKAGGSTTVFANVSGAFNRKVRLQVSRDGTWQTLLKGRLTKKSSSYAFRLHDLPVGAYTLRVWVPIDPGYAFSQSLELRVESVLPSTNAVTDGAWTGTQIPLPRDADVDSKPYVGPTACTTTGVCIATANYVTRSGASATSIDATIGGAWFPTEIPRMHLEGAACTDVGCVVVGDSSATAGATTPYAEVLNNGTWTGHELPLPPDGVPSIWTVLSRVACQPGGTCIATGGYYDKNDVQLPLIETLSLGGWAANATAAPLPDDAGEEPGNREWRGGKGPGLSGGVACPTNGYCVAVGYYHDTAGSYQGLIETLSDGKWTAARAPLPPIAGNPTPRDSYEDADPIYYGLACYAAEHCAAAGTDEVAGGQGMVLTLDGGSWAAETVYPNQALPSVGGLGGVTCSPDGTCLAGGSAYWSDGSMDGIIDSYGKGAWTVGKVAAPSDVSPKARGVAGLGVVACTVVDTCVAAGSYRDVNLNSSGVLATRVLGTWTALKAPVPLGAALNPNTAFVSASCGLTLCVADGIYTDHLGNVQGLLETFAAG